MNRPTLHDQAWLTAPETLAVIDALEAVGGEDCARFVGGCVRNAVMGVAVDDIDIATILTPEQSAQAIERAGLKVVPTGVEHGTITAVAHGAPFEVTTLRRDVATDGRRAVVAFTTDWAEDAQRRDFRFNALYADRSGQIYDPTGHGLADALSGRVVFVGEPMQRIREDYLRILRYFRFLAWYGRGEPDAAALEACQALRETLTRRTAERTQKEILKLLAAPDPRPALELMLRTGVLAAVLPSTEVETVGRLITLEETEPWTLDPLLRLAALVGPEARSAELAAELLRLSNAQRDRLIAAAGTEPRIQSHMSPREARRAIHRLGRGAFQDRVRLAWARTAGEASDWRGLLTLAGRWTPPAFPVAGADVLARGVPSGPQVGQVLAEMDNWWVDQDFRPDREAALRRLDEVVRALKAP